MNISDMNFPILHQIQIFRIIVCTGPIKVLLHLHGNIGRVTRCLFLLHIVLPLFFIEFNVDIHSVSLLFSFSSFEVYFDKVVEDCA